MIEIVLLQIFDSFFAESNQVLSSAAEEKARLYYKSCVNYINKKENWIKCLAETSAYLPIPVLSIIVREAMHPSSLDIANEMKKNIQLAFTDNLKTLTWLDNDGAQWVKEKVEAIKYFIAYPDGISNPEKVYEIYAGLGLLEDDYKENRRRVMSFSNDSRNKTLEIFSDLHNNTNWAQNISPYGKNGLYKRCNNQIWIQAGNLQKYDFNPDFPRWVNYARFGFTIAHELVHAFDDIGRK